MKSTTVKLRPHIKKKTESEPMTLQSKLKPMPVPMTMWTKMKPILAPKVKSAKLSSS